MTPEERNMIAGLFDRMRGFGAPDKDRDAEALINQSMRANPEAAYMLVQSVLVQEQTLQALNDRVMQLEDQLRELQGPEPPRSSRSGGFLSGYWGGRGEPEPRASVPQVGARATPSAYESRSPWSQGGQPQQPPPQQMPPQQVPPAASGGFMRSAMTTAAGVAGGMLVADSIRNMLGGSGAHAGHGATTPAAGSSNSDSSSAATSDSSNAHSDAGYSDKTDYVDETANDPGNYQDDANDPGFDSGETDV